MSYDFDLYPPGSDLDEWFSKDRSKLAKHFFNAGQFIRGLGFQMRFGEISRAPLRLLRLQILPRTVECNWLARSADPWDTDLKPSVQQRLVLLQTLRDAINVRELLFASFPHVDTAYIRVYRESPDYVQEMIIKGCLHRNDNSSCNLHSLVMRARVLGFCFELQGNIMHGIST